MFGRKEKLEGDDHCRRGRNIRGQDKGPLGRRLSQQEEKEGRTK